MWQLAIPALLKEVLERVIPDKAKAQEAQDELQKITVNGELQTLLGQIEINKEEAKSENIFKSGWRPAIGWICAASLGLYYIPRFVIGMIFWAKLAWDAQGILPPMPEMGIADILGLVFALLGMSSLRTYEKTKNG